ncbi:sulfite exporter TauE/SafE family protein [Chitinophagaceae bacterium MMS25-I14]
MNAAALGLAFLMGLTGSLHCAGMCGPFIWIMPFQALKGIRKALAVSAYHFGRISVYAAMGLMLHSFKELFQPQWQQYISIGLGIVLLLIGLMYFIPGRTMQLHLPWTKFVQQRLGKVLARPRTGSLLLAGILNGLLPCGLVYMALSATVTASTAISAAAMMYAFGLGTTPMLVALTVLKGRISLAQNIQLRKFVPVIMLFFGCLFVLRGMNLGIPYLSPKVVVEQGHIKGSCCHRR